MPKWFVHVDQNYYPSAHVVDAETAEEAARVAWGQNGGPGYPIDASEWCIAVVPFDAVEFYGSAQRVRELEELDPYSEPRDCGLSYRETQDG